ncbi:Secreted protein [Frankia sp. AiPs1]|uniref:DUF6049 family protein n=1 Tax=Frankia sp. AiPa1 TaxID=573492 RepID=UPI00202B4475|nr:DUF6049 family protein [Frankia sp. AiPa1]MCL9760696.1 DUF6049 family protein [Frankia sp. AiPa1]
MTVRTANSGPEPFASVRSFAGLLAVTLFVITVLVQLFPVAPALRRVPGFGAAGGAETAAAPSTAGTGQSATPGYSSTGISGASPASSTGQSGGSVSSQPIAARSSSSDPANPITITITQVTEPAAGTSTVSVSGTLATSSTEPISDLWMSISLGTAPVVSRGQLAVLADQPGAASQRVYRKLTLPSGDSVQRLTDLPIGGASPVPFEITGNLGNTAATNVAVYPVRIQISGTIAARAVSAAAYSFVVRSPVSVTRTPVAVVVPIADRPRLRSDGLLTDNELASEVAPQGRLSRLLDAAARPPVTLAVDPTLLQELMIMSSRTGYSFASPGTTAGVAAPRSTDAISFLSRLVVYAANGGNVIALPYGDADLTSLVHAQKLDMVKYAVNTGQVVLAAQLKQPVRESGYVVYPVDGRADATTVDVLRQLEAGTVVLNDQVLPAPRSLKYTPAAAVTLSTSAGTIRALRADSTLSALATAYTGRSGDPSAGALLARFQAELAMITSENPTVRPQVLALPRDWNPSGSWAEQVLGAVSGTATTPSALDDPAFTATAQTATPSAQLVYSTDAQSDTQSTDLPADYLDAVSGVRSEAQALGPVLCPPPRAARTCEGEKVDPMSNALVTATSVWWRGAGMGDGVSLSNQVDGDVSALRNGIRVVASRSVNLTSRHGLVPLTLENNTRYEVTVVLKFSATNQGRLRSPARQVRTLPSGQKAQIEFEVDAEGAGTFPLEIDRLNLAGQRLSSDPPVRVLVRSTVYGVIATGITIFAVSLLGLAVVLRLVHRLRPGARRRPDDRPPDADPGHPSPHGHDPAPTSERDHGYLARAGYDPSHGYSTAAVDDAAPVHVAGDGPFGAGQVRDGRPEDRPFGAGRPLDGPVEGASEAARTDRPRREVGVVHHGGPAHVIRAESPFDASDPPPPRHRRSGP